MKMLTFFVWGSTGPWMDGGMVIRRATTSCLFTYADHFQGTNKQNSLEIVYYYAFLYIWYKMLQDTTVSVNITIQNITHSTD